MRTKCNPSDVYIYNHYNGCWPRYKRSDGISCGIGVYAKGAACESCPAGYFMGNHFQAQTKTVTKDAFFVLAAGSGFKGQSSCKKCGAGTYSATVRSTKCTPCQAGSYSIESKLCFSCPTGQSVNTKGDGCITCSIGQYASAIMTSCENCPSGYYTRQRKRHSANLV